MALQRHSKLLFQLASLVLNVLKGFAMFALLTVNIERLLALVHPILHQASLAKKRIRYSFMFFLLSPVVLSTFCFQEMVTSCIFLFMFIYLNYKIFLVANKGPNNKNRSNRVFIVSTSRAEDRKTNISELRKALTCSLAVISFFLCTLPGIVLSGLCLAWEETMYDEKVLKFSLWIPTSCGINSTLNCLIMLWRNSALRHEGMKVAECLKSERTLDWNTSQSLKSESKKL